MGKYMKNPIVVDAEQFLGSALVRGVHDLQEHAEDEAHRYFVVGADGRQVWAKPGDWIIAEIDGSGYYPCSDYVFKATYSPVDLDLGTVTAQK